MKKTILFLIIVYQFSTLDCEAQNVGIGTSTPMARLHVADSSVVFTATGIIPVTPGNPPVSGAGRRMMWYADKAAFRVGYVAGTAWNKANVGDYSFAAGIETEASGSASVSMGSYTIASGHNSFATGFGATASGEYSFAMGSSTATGNFSAALGLSTANGPYSTAMGNNSIARGYGSTVVGVDNNPILNSPEQIVTPTTPLFIIGNGDGAIGRSNAMVVLKNGNIGISTSAPVVRLHVNGNSSSGNPEILVEENEDDYARLSFKTTAHPAKYWDIAAITKATSTGAELNFFYGGVGNVFSLKATGDATLSGTLTQSSDERLKKNITPMSNSLIHLMKINGYTYNWKDAYKDQSTQIGVLAQEVQKIFPELVKEDSKGLLTVNYSGLIPVVITAIREQQNQIQVLKEQMEELRKLINKR
ncbi:MAG: tail fiber domain-containing protein [Chitinophagaceae bacterium]